MADVSKRPEFMTTWHTGARREIEAWSNRPDAELKNKVTTTRHVPKFRPFDLLDAPNRSRVIVENEDHRIGVESVCGCQDMFLRHVDYDTVYFQFAGNSTVETEFGICEMKPGDLLFIPGGISHRSTGTADCLRWFAWVHEPFTEFMGEDKYTGHAEYEVRRIGGPNWTVPVGREKPVVTERVKERMLCWDDGPSDSTIADRSYADLVGVASQMPREKISGIRLIRGFDVFHEIAGVRGGVEPLLRSPHLELKTYNVVGHQWAYHRAIRTEEIRIQFRGDALDLSEVEDVHITPGEVTVIPLGIAHCVQTDPLDSTDFLRLNFYSNLRWRYPTDLTKAVYDSRFEIKTTVHRRPAWMTAAE